MTDQKIIKLRKPTPPIERAFKLIKDDPSINDLTKEEKRLLAQALLGTTPLNISPTVLARSRTRANKQNDQAIARLQRDQAVENAKQIFTPSRPPPGVLPEGMAFDELPGTAPQLVVSGWASQLGYNSAFQEGTTFLGYAYLSELAQRAEYRVMSEVIGSEMTREWIDFKVASGDKGKDEKLKELADEFKRLKVQSHFAKAAIHDGFFGRGHLYIDTGDTDRRDELKTSIGDGKSELSKNKVNKKKPLVAIRNVEPVWAYPTQYDSNNPLNPDWYKPTSWFVMAQEIHSTRFLTFIGREVPDLLKPAYSFGGLSMSQMAKPYVDNWLRTRQSVADIIQAFSVMVLKTDLATTLQNGGEQLFARLELFNNLRNNRGTMAIDKNAEDFANVSAPLGSLDALQAQTQEHLASVSRIPTVKLLGIQPAGLNASSEGEIRSFYDWIKAFQELLFRDNLERIMRFVMLSLWNEVDPEITFDFKDLWQLDAAGKSAIEKTKADTYDAYIAMGVVTAEEVREAQANDPDSPFNGIDLSKPLPEPDLGDLGNEPPDGEADLSTELPEHAGKASDPSDRLATSVTSKAANLGGAENAA